MKALNNVGPFNVRAQEVEGPRLEHPDDIIVKVTSVCIEAVESMSVLIGTPGCHLRLRLAVSLQIVNVSSLFTRTQHV
jgi:hypothetical protein